MPPKTPSLLFLVALPWLWSMSVAAEESISNRAKLVTEKLEVLNDLGRDCNAALSVSGKQAQESKQCQKYLKNMSGTYLDSVRKECAQLKNWYEQKQKFISANKNYVDEHPKDAAQLIRDMKAIKGACSDDSLTGYTYITKPLDKMKAMDSLQ